MDLKVCGQIKNVPEQFEQVFLEKNSKYLLLTSTILAIFNCLYLKYVKKMSTLAALAIRIADKENPIKRRRQKKYVCILKQEINSRRCLLTKCWILLKSSKGLQSIFNNVVTDTRQPYKGSLECTKCIVTCVVLYYIHISLRQVKML